MKNFFIGALVLITVTFVLYGGVAAADRVITLDDVIKPFNVTAEDRIAARSAGWEDIQQDWAFKAWGQGLEYTVVATDDDVTFVKIKFDKGSGNGKEWYIHLLAAPIDDGFGVRWCPSETPKLVNCKWYSAL